MSVALYDIFDTRWVGRCFNQRIMLTHKYYVSNVVGTINDLDAEAALGIELTAGGGGDLMETAYRAILPPDYELLLVDVQKIYPTRMRTVPITRGQIGTNANVAYQANVHAALEFVTNFAGRDHVSVKKIGPIPQHISLYDDGVITATLGTLLGTLATAMKAQPNVLTGSLEFTPCIYHKGVVPNFTEITGHKIQDSIRVKTRRTVRVGE